MIDKQFIKKTFQFVQEELKNDFTGHDINHIKRVYKIMEEILKTLECEKDVVRLAVILHDIDDYKVTGIKTEDCIKARNYLQNNSLEQEFIEKVCFIINNMSYSKNLDAKKKLSLEGMIVQDADRIDALGAVGIARTFQFGGKNNRQMYGNDSTFSHFDDKLLKIYDLLNTKEAKRMAQERSDFLIHFYHQFKKEIAE